MDARCIPIHVKDTRAVNRKILKAKIKELGAQGVEKFAVNSCCSASLVRAMMRGKAPKQSAIRKSVAQALNLPEEMVFPDIG